MYQAYPRPQEGMGMGPAIALLQLPCLTGSFFNLMKFYIFKMSSWWDLLFLHLPQQLGQPFSWSRWGTLLELCAWN